MSSMPKSFPNSQRNRMSFYKRKQSDEAEYNRRCEYQIAVYKKLQEQETER